MDKEKTRYTCISCKAELRKPVDRKHACPKCGFVKGRQTVREGIHYADALIFALGLGLLAAFGVFLGLYYGQLEPVWLAGCAIGFIVGLVVSVWGLIRMKT